MCYYINKKIHFWVLTIIIVVARALVLSHILFNCFTGPIRNMVLYNRSAFNASVMQHVRVLTYMGNWRVDPLTCTRRRRFQKCKTRWREWGQSSGGRACQHPAGHRRTPLFLASYLNSSWYLKTWLVGPDEWMSFTFLRARRTRRAAPTVRVSSLWWPTQQVSHDSKSPGPYQDCAADPHHEAADKPLHTRSPS